MNKGTIVQVIGAVVDVDFSQAQMPTIYNALTVDYTVNGESKSLVLEVEQHLADGWVRTVAMSSTDGLQRGMEAVDTGKAISVPVGPSNYLVSYYDGLISILLYNNRCSNQSKSLF